MIEPNNQRRCETTGYNALNIKYLLSDKKHYYTQK
jgi:hypothetical protein